MAIVSSSSDCISTSELTLAGAVTSLPLISLNPYFRQCAQRVIREIVSHFKDHPALIGYQIDNESFPHGVPTPYMNAASLERLKKKYKTPETINKIWGLAYWG
jgi:beta-galactosidase